MDALQKIASQNGEILTLRRVLRMVRAACQGAKELGANPADRVLDLIAPYEIDGNTSDHT